MKTTLKKLALAATSAAVLGGAASSAQAANWLMLQGTEPADAAARAKVWGFVQAQWQKDTSDACKFSPCTDQYIPPKLIGPNLTSQEAFNVNRARIGVRGTGLPLDSKVNYFVLLEMGNNAITEGTGAFAKATDASITLNHIKGARVRMGLFKYPGAEEGLQAIHVFDYVNFTEVTNQLLLERIPNTDGDLNTNLYLPGRGGLLGDEQNAFYNGVSAFRDVGIQVFDAFHVGNWEHSYAVMYGNGNGLNLSDNDDEKDVYFYLSTERVYGGKGPFREGLKFFAWMQDGKRSLDRTADGVFNPEKFDRERSGLGVKYKKGNWRFTAEYMKGEGMIFVGPDKPTYDQNGGGPNGDGATGEASGYYVDAGYRFPKSKWQVDLRYDFYDRLEDDALESEWQTITLGANYHFNRKTRFTFNYAMRDVDSIKQRDAGVLPVGPTTPNPNNNMQTIEDRISLQVTHIF
jgi:opacity protein-like surface antigen